MPGRSLFKKRDDKLINKHHQDAVQAEAPNMHPSQAQEAIAADPSHQATVSGKSTTLSPKRGPNKQTPKAKSNETSHGSGKTWTY